MRPSRVIAIAVAAIAAVTVLPPAPAAEAAVSRISGDNRFSTSAAISRAIGGTGGTVFLASGQSFPDALAAGPVAAAEGGRLLLTEPGDIPPAIEAELSRVRPARIVVVGGVGTISDAVAAEALGYVADRSRPDAVTRIGGSDRIETSMLLLDRQRATRAPSTVWVVSASSFADALAAGAVAARQGHGLILTSGADASFQDRVRARVAPGMRFEIAGGAAAVGGDVESFLSGIASGGVGRSQGVDRFETSAVINSRFTQSASQSTMILASGESFPDGLGASVLAGVRGMPLYLVPRECLRGNGVRDERARLGIQNQLVIGGTGAVSQQAANLERCPDVGAAQAEVIAIVNAHRAMIGAAPLAAHGGLMSMAQGWSGSMAGQQSMVHSTTFCNETFAMGFRRCAENIARTGSASAQGVMDAWMNSPGHRANILNPNLTHIGVGLVQGGDGRWYWTQNFGGF